ncbi:MAG: nucleoside deaminase [Elainellaceae cyanobacterium]
MTEPNPEFMREAIAQSLEGMRCGHGGPFGAVIVKDGKIIARGYNRVLTSNDPTAHAEVSVIRDACQQLQSFQLDGCELYTSCEPCPMCLGAIYWSRLDRVYYGNTKVDAAAAGFDDQFIYDELDVPMGDRQLPMKPFLREEAQSAFQEWIEKSDKTPY